MNAHHEIQTRRRYVSSFATLCRQSRKQSDAFDRAEQIFAAGDVGAEEFALRIDGQIVQQYSAQQQLQAFTYQTKSKRS